MDHYLVFVDHEGDLGPLVDALTALTRGGPCRFHVVEPLRPTPGLVTSEGQEHAAATTRLRRMTGALRACGLDADGALGEESVVQSVVDALAERPYLGVVVSTPPTRLSPLHLDVVHRLQRAVDVPVLHVVSHDARPLARGLA